MVESYEHGKAREGSINGRTLLDLPSDYCLAVLLVHLPQLKVLKLSK